jgi:recombination protein RecT
VLAIKEGELIRFDPLNEEIDVKLIEDEEEREQAVTIGYYAMFEYTNGFKKAIYWSKKKMEAHALKYSMGYRAKKGFTFWEKDFDSMAYKTMLRQLISRWGIMSIDLMSAMDADMAVINEDGTKEYVDSEEVITMQPEEIPQPENTEYSDNEAEQPGNAAAAALFGQ